MNSDYKTEEVEYFLSDSDSKLFITDTDRYQKHRPALEALGVKTAIVDAGDAICLPTLLEGIAPVLKRTCPARDDELAIIHMDTLPRTAMGKVQEKRIIEQYRS